MSLSPAKALKHNRPLFFEQIKEGTPYGICMRGVSFCKIVLEVFCYFHHYHILIILYIKLKILRLLFLFYSL